MKQRFQRYKPIIIPALILTAVWGLLLLFGVEDIALYVSVAGVILSLAYFWQRQRLEETRLQKELFSEFNQRYSDLNDDLNEIVEADNGHVLKPEQIHRLYEYFNLCGEEYFFFKQGYVHPDVWDAWLNGMRYYYDESKAIRKVWDAELTKYSYYGFSPDLLKA